MKAGFSYIALDAYVRLYLHANPGSNRRELLRALESAVAAQRAGVRCQCGQPLWVVGSASAGNACFTCITGESFPDHDYEIAVDAPRCVRARRVPDRIRRPRPASHRGQG